MSVDGEGADWVTERKEAIKKANLTFTAKFLWFIVRHCLSLTAADNIITWDRAVLMAAIIAWFEVVLLGIYRQSCTRGLLRSELPFPVHDIFSLHVRRCAYIAR